MKGSILVSEVVERSHRDALERAAPDVPRVVFSDGGVRGDLAGVEIVNFSGDLYPDRTPDFIRAAVTSKRLGWFHTFSAGVDNPFFRGLVERGVRLTTSSGAHAVPIAQTVMLYLLAFSRDLRGWLDAQSRRAWEPCDIQDLQGRSLGILGMGPIGLEVARLGLAFGMHVTGLRRTPRGDEPCETWPLGRLDDLLPAVDYLVIALPLTPETRGLLDAAALARLRREAVLVNIARGEIVDEAALTDALREGRIAGAALDVFAVEPLPATSPLWSLENVIVTPHSSGTNPGNHARATEIFLENLGRYVRGESLRNEVSPSDLTGPGAERA